MGVQTIYTAATGMNSMQTKLNTISNNLANVETTAFKASRTNFEDLLYRYEKLPGSEDASGQYAPHGIAIGLGSRVSSIQPDFSQGSLVTTGRQLDVAIQGGGFFQALDPSGQTYYTRAGNFARNSNGNMVFGSATTGRLLQPPIVIPPDASDIVISPDGTVSVRQPNNQQLSQIGKIELAHFINPEGLIQQGENMVAESQASGSPVLGTPGQDGMGTLQQSALEHSNVDPVSSLIDLISTQRSFEMNSQAVKVGDSMMQIVNSMVRT
jgi:flagellar basal-body rod protein FlgG